MPASYNTCTRSSFNVVPNEGKDNESNTDAQCYVSDKSTQSENSVSDDALVNSKHNQASFSSHRNHRKRKMQRRSKKGNKSHSNQSVLNIAFNNVNRVKNKEYEISKLIDKENIDIFGIAETFLKNDDGIEIKGYRWIGKKRTRKGGGGIGFLVSDKTKIVDDNLFDSKLDDIERQWIKISTGNVPIFIAVAYFPVEGVDIDRSDELYTQLLSDCIRIEETCVNESEIDNEPRIIIMADCNGRIGNAIPFCDKETNSNGERLLNFADNSGLQILNCTKLCYGKYTWFRHNLKSAIDYMLCSKSVLKYAKKFTVDDERDMNIGSDHNVLLLNCIVEVGKANTATCSDTSDHSQQDNCYFWDIGINHDWSDFQNEISYKFSDWNYNQFNDIDSLWHSWKDNFIETATATIGIRKTNSKLRKWWDKDIDEGIKERKVACKAHRLWYKGNTRDINVGDGLWSDYQSKRSHVKNIIRDKIMKSRVEKSMKIAQEGGPHNRKFWKNLRGNKRKQEIYSLKDPGSDKIVTDSKHMKTCVLYYWRTLGKMNSELNNANNDVFTYNAEQMVNHYRSISVNQNISSNEYLHSINLTHKMVDAIKNSKNN